MKVRHVHLDDVQQVPYVIGDKVAATRADVGRTLGSANIGLAIQRVEPGKRSSRLHRHVFQEEILLVHSGTGVLLHGEERIPVRAGDAFCYVAGDPEAHTFENTSLEETLVIWAFGNRFPHEVCEYPEEGLAFVEGLNAEVPLNNTAPSEWAKIADKMDKKAE